MTTAAIRVTANCNSNSEKDRNAQNELVATKATATSVLGVQGCPCTLETLCHNADNPGYWGPDCEWLKNSYPGMWYLEHGGEHLYCPPILGLKGTESVSESVYDVCV